MYIISALNEYIYNIIINIIHILNILVNWYVVILTIQEY